MHIKNKGEKVISQGMWFLIFLLLPFLSHSTVQVVIIGDSITFGGYAPLQPNEVYTSLLEEDLKTCYDIKIVSFGVGTMGSSGAASCLLSLYQNFYPQAFNPQIAVLTTGINNLGIKNFELVKNALESFIFVCQQKGVIPIIGTFDIRAFYPKVTIPYIKQFNGVFQEAVQKYQLHSFQFLGPEIMGDPLNHIGDQIHPTMSGHRIIYQNLKPVLVNLLDQLEGSKK